MNEESQLTSLRSARDAAHALVQLGLKVGPVPSRLELVDMDLDLSLLGRTKERRGEVSRVGMVGLRVGL